MHIILHYVCGHRDLFKVLTKAFVSSTIHKQQLLHFPWTNCGLVNEEFLRNMAATLCVLAYKKFSGTKEVDREYILEILDLLVCWISQWLLL